MFDFELDTKKITDVVTLEKNILIYAHQKFSTNDGGITVQYYLAYTLSKLGINTQIYNEHDKNAHNCIYNNFVDNIENIDFDNTIVIYCEGVQGNPLNAKYVVRWMLSKLGQNVPYHYYYTWNKNELVYFFNSEKEMVDNNKHFKLLTLYYFNSEINNNNNERKGLCYTTRKKRKFKNNVDINIINNTYNLIKLPVYEITRCQDQRDYIDIFNKHEYFMTYDPYTFLSIIAILCGCISIIYPIDEVSKIEYFKMTPYYEYMVEKNCFEIYGLAYGMTDEEINYAKNTMHLAKDQMIDIQKWFINKNIKQFLVDINDWSKNYNTLKYYKYSMCENIPILDIDFYRSVHIDLHDYSDVEAIDHYNNYGIHEKRLFSEKHFYDLYPNFDIKFYKNIHKDLNNRPTNFLLYHYFLYGEKEERLISKKHFDELYPEFDIDYYKSFNDEFKNMTNDQLMYHYHEFGSKINKNSFFNTSLYNKYKNNVDYKEKIYLNDLNINDIIKKLEKNNSKILICNGDYNEASGGITVLHYFCHVLNYTAKKNIAYIVGVFRLPNGTFKKIDDYESRDYYLKENPEYLTPCATPEILLNRNNIVIYMDSIEGNPLEQKYVVRWVLYFELSRRIKTWNKNDLIIWFIETYQKYSKHIQKVNNEEPINYQEIPNKQIVMPIISNINRVLAFGENNESNVKNGICFTIRKSGDNINADRRLRKIDTIGERCKNCQKNIWPCICNCENYTNGVKLLHSKENIVYRFEYPVNLNDEIDLFAKTEKFYMYDPFCFSAVIAALKNCLTIVPKLDSFEDDNPYENVPWMKYGISYGTDEESIIEAKKTLPFTKEKLTEVFFDLNYNSLTIFYNAINDFF